MTMAANQRHKAPTTALQALVTPLAVLLQTITTQNALLQA
jgi:hypothetical protein